MRAYTTDFKINGQPMLAPDAGVGFSYEDLDAEDSGRDEAGFMHRDVARYKVGSWSIPYSNLTEQERKYTEGLFPDEPTFDFTHPDRKTGEPVTTECYRSKYSISWYNARTGLWKNYNFNIIEC